MIPDIDLSRFAAIMVKRYGDTADIEAAKREIEFLAEGQIGGQREWLRIPKAIDKLQNVQRPRTKLEVAGEQFKKLESCESGDGDSSLSALSASASGCLYSRISKKASSSQQLAGAHGQPQDPQCAWPGPFSETRVAL